MQRFKQRVDKNQKQLVKDLRTIPGVTVRTGHDDLFVGFRGRNYWLEVKDPETAISKKTGKVNPSSVQPSQKTLEKEWTGQFSFVSSFDDCLAVLGV